MADTENVKTDTSVPALVGRVAPKFNTRFPKIILFTLGSHPDEAEMAEFDALRTQHGPNVVTRNAALVSDVPHSALEECDAVAGAFIPPRYARTYPALDGLTADIINRASDYDLPHATMTGSILDAGNEAARAAKPPTISELASGSAAMGGAPRQANLLTQPGGGSVIPGARTQTLGSFGSERGENPAVGGLNGVSASEGSATMSDGLDRSPDTARTGEKPADAVQPIGDTTGNPAASGFGPTPTPVPAADDTSKTTAKKK